MAWPHAPWTLPLLPYVLIVCFCYVACLDSVFKFDYRMVHLVQSQREEEPSWGRHSRTQVLRVLCLRNEVWSEHMVHLGCRAAPPLWRLPFICSLILSINPLFFHSPPLQHSSSSPFISPCAKGAECPTPSPISFLSGRLWGTMAEQ